jgi:hypothetical protein
VAAPAAAAETSAAKVGVAALAAAAETSAGTTGSEAPAAAPLAWRRAVGLLLQGALERSAPHPPRLVKRGAEIRVRGEATEREAAALVRGLLGGAPIPDGCRALEARIARCRNELTLVGRPGLRYRYRNSLGYADRKAVGYWMRDHGKQLLRAAAPLLRACRRGPASARMVVAAACLTRRGCEAFAGCLRPLLPAVKPPPTPPLNPRPERFEQAVRAAVLMRHRGLRTCYERALLTEGPGLGGEVVFRLTVQPSGKMGRVEVVSRTLESDAAIRCLTERLRALRLPASDSVTVVTYPLRFRTGS